MIPRTLFVGGTPEAGLETFLGTMARLTDSTEFLVSPETHPRHGTPGFRVRRSDRYDPATAYADAVENIRRRTGVPDPTDVAVAFELHRSTKTLERWRKKRLIGGGRSRPNP